MILDVPNTVANTSRPHRRIDFAMINIISKTVRRIKLREQLKALRLIVFTMTVALSIDGSYARTLGRSEFVDTIKFYDASVKGTLEIKTVELTPEIWRGFANIKISKVFRDVRGVLRPGQILRCPFSLLLTQDDFFFEEESRYFSINYTSQPGACTIERAKHNYR